MLNPKVNYYALRVAPQSEFDVQRALTQREIPALVPREFKWRTTQRRHRVKRAYPLFARYVFAGMQDVRSDLVALRRDIEEIQGVVCRSRIEWSPLEISQKDLELLHSLAGHEVAMTTVDIHRALKPGGLAQIVLGPFAGQTVKVDKVTERRAKVLLKVLNSSHIVELPVEALDAA